MGCNKIKNTCVDKHFASCVYYELDTPSFSDLEDCVTIEETTQELYEVLDNVRTKVDINDGVVLTELLEEKQDQIDVLQEKVETLENQNVCEQSIENCNLDLQGLVDVCGEEPTTVGQLLQILINELNN